MKLRARREADLPHSVEGALDGRRQQRGDDRRHPSCNYIRKTKKRGEQSARRAFATDWRIIRRYACERMTPRALATVHPMLVPTASFMRSNTTNGRTAATSAGTSPMDPTIMS